MLVVFRKPPLLLSIILVILSSFVAPSSSSNRTRFIDNINMNEYDVDADDETEPTSAPQPAAEQCNYSFCQDQQPSCQQLAALKGCSCPGMSGPSEPPDPPHLHRLSQESSGRVVAHWCAPASTVTHYLVWVEGRDGEMETGETRRQMDIGKIAADAEVCVQAANWAGVSNRVKHSCTRFQPQSSESGLALRLAIIAGVVVVLIVVLVLALLLWRFRTRRKTKARAEAGGAEAVL